MYETMYTLKLFSEDENLDLRKHEKEIKEVLRYIENGGKSGDSFKEVEEINNIEVHKRELKFDVWELSKDWHSHLGRMLVRKGMEHFPILVNNSYRMFEWEDFVIPF